MSDGGVVLGIIGVVFIGVISLGVGFQESNIWLIIVGVVFFIIMTIILRYQVRKVYKK